MLYVPKHILAEEMDRRRQQAWEDPDRYPKMKAKALRYIAVRGPELRHVDKLLQEVTLVFHDDLRTDPDIKEAIERTVHGAGGQLPRPTKQEEERAAPRGLDDLTDEKLLDLEQQYEAAEKD